MTKVNILGTIYTIYEKTSEEDKHLLTCDGYCDKTTKKIVVTKERYGNFEDFDMYFKHIKRHEIIHAFLHESGLLDNWEHPTKWGQDETAVDWLAWQFPKIYEAFKQVGCI